MCIALLCITAFPNLCQSISNTEKYSVVGRGAVTQWLRHYAKNRQVAGSIPSGVTGIFQ